MSPELIRKFYGQLRDCPMVDIYPTMLNCMDDRISEASLMTAGGDLGEFLLGVYVYSTFVQSSGVLLNEQTIKDLLSRYLAQTPSQRKFCHCTDDTSVQHLAKELGLVDLDLITPPFSEFASVKEKLKEPENNGDLHFRSLLSVRLFIG